MKRILLLVILILSIGLPTPVFAIANPDSGPYVNYAYVFEDGLEDGDIGVLIDYNIPYAVIPTTETAAESYLASFIDSDGTTQLKTSAPYVYNDSGYNHGLIWIYFSPTEVALYGLNSADVALYRIWLMGNPTVPSGWPGAPPKTSKTIDTWYTTGSTETLLALKVLYYADALEVEWLLDLVQETSTGNKLTTAGQSYFTNVIPLLRDICPSVFADSELSPEYPSVDFDTKFGAIAQSGGATIAGSPVTLVSGTNTINTGATIGTIQLLLDAFTFGTVTNGTGTVTGSPCTINPGTNTLTVTVAGTFTVVVNETSTSTLMEASVTGTGLDLTNVAAKFGMSRWTFSGLIWLLITIIVCAAVYVGGRSTGSFGADSGATKVVMVCFTVMVIIGTLLGLLTSLITALLLIACGFMIGWVLFYQSDSLHKNVMFMVWMWLITCIAGNVAAGNSTIMATYLTADIPAGTITSISVGSTEGWGEAGQIMIDDEIIGYPKKSATTFEDTDILGITTNPILRGQQGTDDVAHLTGAVVRSIEAGVLNSAMDYKIARIVDSAGGIGILALPFLLFDLILTFLILPLGFLGTDLQILTYIWAVFAIGMIYGIGSSMLGSRRV
jgi:hypothetical protein